MRAQRWLTRLPMQALLLGGLWLAGTAGWAQELFSPLQLVPLPLPPGERGITRLLLQPDGQVYGLVPLPEGQWRSVRIAPAGAEAIDAVPALVTPPARLLTAPDLAWQWDPARQRGYLLDAAGRLLAYRADGTTTDLGQVAGTRPFEEKTGYQLSRALLLTPAGDLYTAGAQGAIYHYAPGAAAVEKLKVRLPSVLGREAWASLDAAVLGPDNRIYGGTFDGYLFVFDPAAGTVVNYGKPFRAPRIATLIFRRGILFGVGGGEADIPRVFSFDPATHGFTLGGLFTRGAKMHNYFEPVAASVADPAGNIYVTTAGRLGDLYLWPKD